MVNPLPLDSEPNPPNPLPLDSTPPNVPLPPEVVDKRAEKAHFGLNQEIPKEKAEYAEAIRSGNESAVRQEVASTLDSKRYSEAHNTITEALAQKTDPIQETDLDQIRSLINFPSENPDSVFEKNFGKAYSNVAFNNLPYLSPWLHDAVDEDPRAVNAFHGISGELSAKYAYFRRWQEDLQAEANKEPWGQYFAEKIAGQIPFYQDYLTRNTVPGTTFSGGPIGSNIEAQGQKIFNMPFDQMVKEFPGYIKGLKENYPGIALDLVTRLIGSTQTDQSFSNLQEGIDAVSVFGPAAVGAGKRMFSGSLAQAGADMVRTLPMVEQQPVKVVAAAAAGDMASAGEGKVAAQIGRGMRDNPTPTNDAIDAVTSDFKFDRVDPTNNPARYGQEIANRLNEILDTGERNVTKALQDAYRVNVSPELAEESFVKELNKATKGNYKSIENAILDRTDPIHDPASNSWYRAYRLGTPDGELFTDYDTLRNFARDYGLVLKETNLDRRISAIEEDLRRPPEMEADVHELNRRDALEKELANLKAQPREPTGATGEGFTVGTQPIEHKGVSFWADKGEPKQFSLGYYINYWRFEDITSDAMRDTLIKLYPQGNKLPPSWFGNWVNATYGWVRSPEDTLSIWENEARKVAVHGPNRILQLAKEVTEPLESLPRKYWKDFDRFIRAGQKKIDPESPDAVPGYWFKDIADVEHWYNTNLKRLPSRAELEAYWAYKASMNFDHALRNVAEYTYRARQGTEQHRITLTDVDNNVHKSTWFDGIKLDHLPGGDDGVVVFGDNIGEEKVYKSSSAPFMPAKTSKKLMEEIQQGKRQVIELYNTDVQSLSGFTDKLQNRSVRYIVTKKFETKPLNADIVPRRGGGHVVPDYDWYGKQAIFDNQESGQPGATRNIYRGDKTLFAARSQAEAEHYIEHLKNIQRLLRERRTKEAEVYSRKFMKDNWKTIHDKFKPSRAPDGTELPAEIHLEHPIRAVPKNKTMLDLDKDLENIPGFRDGTKSGNRARLFNTEFTQQRDARDLFVVRNKGTVKNPLFSYEPADTIDPVTVLNRGLRRITQSTFINDYKMFAAEHFTAQARHYLKASDKELRAAPFYHLFKEGGPDWKPWNSGNFANKSILMGNWKKTMDLIGVPSVWDTFTRSAAENLINSIYKGIGPKAADIADYMIPRTTNPLAFFRKVTFHKSMGLFSVPQFFTQLSTHTNLFAISPRHASSGTLGMLLHSWSSMNASEAILRALDAKATQMRLPGTVGWRPGWWLEARKELIDSGFGHIGSENVFKDAPWDTKLINTGAKGAFQKYVLDWGELPFKLGAGSIRTSSWYTSYLEWRNANPTKTITVADRTKILNRATLLDHNQSRASSSFMHTGAMSVPFQFYAYSLRLFDMMTGRRLTMVEKARLFGVSSVMYGVPLGGIGLFGFPLGDYIRSKVRSGEYPIPGTQMQLPKGAEYVPGEHPMYDFAMNGLPNVIMKAITGNSYNISKFGVKGIDPLENLFDSDKTIADIAGGASMATVKEIWQDATPWRMWASSVISGEQDRFPITSADVLRAASAITSVNHGRQAIIGARTGQWLSKNGNYLTDVSAVNAFFMGLTGLSPEGIQDSYMDQKYINDQRDIDKSILNEYLRAMHLGVMANEQHDWNHAQEFFTQAKAFMALYPDEKKNAALQLAYENNTPYISRVQWNKYMKDVPQGKQDQFRDILRRIQEEKGE